MQLCGSRTNVTSANNVPVPMDLGALCTGTLREQKTKERATAIEDAKDMSRSKECPREEREPKNFVGRSTCGTWGHKRAHRQQKHVNALNVPVTSSSPPVSSSASSGVPSSVGALTREDLWIMAVPSFSWNVENGESSCLDTGSEAHVCARDFPREAMSCLTLPVRCGSSLKM